MDIIEIKPAPDDHESYFKKVGAIPSESPSYHKRKEPPFLRNRCHLSFRNSKLFFLKSLKATWLILLIIETQREESGINRKNFNEDIETLYLAPTQFCFLPGVYFLFFEK